MPTDYDAPRAQNTDESDQSLEDIATRRREQADVAVLDAVSYTHLTLPTTPYV